jgi:glycerophosphoryl diester phosphodiesterase
MAAISLAAPAALAFDLEGHRGARGLAPENTLPAFATALSVGVTTLEFDLGMTRDGVLVVAHDRRLNPDLARKDGQYVAAPGATIRSLSLAELKAYEVGALRPGSRYAQQFATQKSISGTSIPTLREVVGLVRKAGNADVRFNIETKLSPIAPDEAPQPEEFARTLVTELQALGIAERTVVQSFEWRALREVQKLAPGMRTACLSIERGEGDNIQRGRAGASPWTAGLDIDDVAGSVARLVHAAGCRIWSPFFRDLSESALREARALGLKIVVWTVNDPEEMARLIDFGVDGIISDYPDRLRHVVAEKGLPLPRATPVDP